MNTYSMIGATVVTFALLSYATGVITEQRKRTITRVVLIFLTTGITLDITATTFMIIGSTNTPFTFHGFLGYSALLAMLIDTILIWRTFRNNGYGKTVSRAVHLYSRYAFLWWVIAYITGSMLVMFK